MLSDTAQGWRSRKVFYAGICLVLLLLALVIGLWSGRRSGLAFNNVRGDGRYYYAYLPSAVLDGDLDFANQVREHWDTAFRPDMLEDRTETGLVRNKYPIGLALTLLPPFLIGHAGALLSHGTIPTDGYSYPYQVACLAWMALLLWRVLCQVDRMLTERLQVPPGPTVLGLAVLVLGTPCIYYATREPFMVHIVSLFWCTETAAVAVGVCGAGRGFWCRLAFCGAMAVVCRPTNLFLLPLAAYGVVRHLREHGWREGLRGWPLATATLVPLALQLVSWKILYGRWLPYTYGEEHFVWSRPALWQTLFSSRHGLFLWSPILLAAALALVRRLREPCVACWLLGGALLWYANSAWPCWWFGDAFGGRAFLELSGLFGLGCGLLFESLQRAPGKAAGVALLAISYNFVLMALYITQRIPADGYVLGW